MLLAPTDHRQRSFSFESPSKNNNYSHWNIRLQIYVFSLHVIMILWSRHFLDGPCIFTRRKSKKNNIDRGKTCITTTRRPRVNSTTRRQCYRYNCTYLFCRRRNYANRNLLKSATTWVLFVLAGKRQNLYWNNSSFGTRTTGTHTSDPKSSIKPALYALSVRFTYNYVVRAWWGCFVYANESVGNENITLFFHSISHVFNHASKPYCFSWLLRTECFIS